MSHVAANALGVRMLDSARDLVNVARAALAADPDGLAEAGFAVAGLPRLQALAHMSAVAGDAVTDAGVAVHGLAGELSDPVQAGQAKRAAALLAHAAHVAATTERRLEGSIPHLLGADEQAGQAIRMQFVPADGAGRILDAMAGEDEVGQVAGELLARLDASAQPGAALEPLMRRLTSVADRIDPDTESGAWRQTAVAAASRNFALLDAAAQAGDTGSHVDVAHSSLRRWLELAESGMPHEDGVLRRT